MNNILTESHLRKLRQKMSADQHRPTFHFLSPSNWINDPHGLIEWQGKYHLFYQYNPYGPFHGTIHWGHAISDDLVYWRDLPVALTPEPDLYDQDGCWSGCAVNDNGLPTLFYTAAHPQTVAAAVSRDDLITWEKVAKNPLISGPPEEIGALAGGHFRDPFIWKTDDDWEMIIASKVEGKGGQVLLYSSKDLRHWDYKGIFWGGDSSQTEPFWQGTMWECPNLLGFGDRQVLFLSVQATPSDHLYAVYFSGKRVGDRFVPVSSQMLVHGGSFYAPQAMRIADGRFIMFGWLPEERSQQACMEAGWNGTHSLPLELNLLDDGAVAVTPIQELQKLRGEHWHENEIDLFGETETILPHITGKALEIQIELLPDEQSECGLKVFCSPDGEEETRIVYKRESEQIFVERDQASLDQRADVNPATMPVALTAGESLRWRVFIDHSIVTVFVNERLCLICRVYPTRDDSQGVRLFSRWGETLVSEIKIWHMNAIWPTQEE
ncbi:MAG: glycoside hydrolase family 32 protein [Anaerolineales bacterium]|nr:glycoside hydrolase family 32 protein [Anaerolineales bacterium]